MAADDEDDVQTSDGDPLGAGEGPRRASFEPPPLPGDDRYDDDALADALAASFPSPITGAIPTVSAPAPIVEPEPEPEPEPAAEPEPELETEPQVEAEDTPAPEYDSPASWVPSADDYRFAPPPSPEDWPPPPEDRQPADDVPPPVDDVPPPEPDPNEPPPWASAPAPDPAQAVDLPQGPPQRPVRRSLPDDELIGWVEEAAAEPGGTLNVIEGLQSQLNLRIQEAREFSDWEQTMLADGSPDALAAVEEARPEFTGVLPDLGAALTGAAAAPAVAESTDRMPPDQPAWEAQPPVEPASEEPEPAAIEEPEPEVEPVPAVAEEPEPAAAAAEEPGVAPEPELLPEFAVPTGWFVPPVEVDAPAVPVTGEVPLDEAPEDPAPIDPFLDGEPPAMPIAGVTMPDEQLPAPTLEPDDSASEAITEPPTAPEETPAQADDAPAVLDEAPHFLPEPSSEPLAPTAGVPIQPPPLVEPPPFGTSGVPKPPLDAAEAAAAAGVADPFDSLLKGDEEPPPAEPADDRGVESLFIEPLPAVAGGQLSETGTIEIVDRSYEVDAEDDAVDETDRVAPALGPVAVDTAGIAIVPPVVHPPSGPIATVRVPPDESVLATEKLEKPKVFTLEAASVEPTPTEQRVGRAARLFWLWFAANASLLSIAVGAAIFGLGMSLRQSIVATLAGIALSFFPLGLSTLAGKRSGQPTMVVSRATFGLLGNIVPSVLSLVSRVFWGAVLLWFLSTATSSLLVGAELDGGIGERALQLIVFAVGLVLAVVIAVFGYGLLAKVQLVISIVAGILVVAMIAMTANYISIGQALTTPDGPWILVVTGAVLVFSFVGLAWANSGGDLARYQRVGSSGAVSMLWATFGATLPAFLLIAYGALLAASNQGIASGFVAAPIDTLALMLPPWYPIPVLLSVGLSLLSGISITLYSGGFSLQAAGLRVARPIAVAISAALVALITALLLVAFGGSVTALFRDAVTTIAVPIAAWAGIFASELMIRNRRFETMSLLRRGGVYADVRWGNLIALIVITAIGWAFTTASIGWLSWQGFGFTLLGFGLESDVAGSDLGVLVALALGILVPIIIGIPAIRRQEAAEPIDV